MKQRCIKKPFDTISWCGRETRCDVVSYNLDSLLLNISHGRDMVICHNCSKELKNKIISWNCNNNLEEFK